MSINYFYNTVFHAFSLFAGNTHFVFLDTIVELYPSNSSLSVPLQIIDVDSEVQFDTFLYLRLEIVLSPALVYLGRDLMIVNITEDDSKQQYTI